jgi:hypothetical protein
MVTEYPGSLNPKMRQIPSLRGAFKFCRIKTNLNVNHKVAKSQSHEFTFVFWSLCDLVVFIRLNFLQESTTFERSPRYVKSKLHN